jgi:hypothetical protein
LNAAILRAHFIPQLKKFRSRKTLKSWEKGWIKRWENIVPFTTNLIPVRPSQAKKLRGNLFQPETIIKKGPKRGQTKMHPPILAVQLRNTSFRAKIKKIASDKMLVADHGREWIYVHTPDTATDTMIEYAQHAFEEDGDEGDEGDDPAQFDIERMLALAERAFKDPTTKAVTLWAKSGRAGDIFPTFRQFLHWALTYYVQYEDTEEWVNGIAVLVTDVGDAEITNEEWLSFNRKPED